MSKDEEVKEVKEEKVKKIKPIITCRVLFITVLDKILFVLLALGFVCATYFNFLGDLSSLSYGYFARLFSEAGIVLGFVILYFFYNWLYSCLAKTMLCLTDTEVYIEGYVPFKKALTTIPLNHITSVSAFTAFWIFRAVIIFQYGRLPIIFWTWKNEIFRDEYSKLVVKDKDPFENEFESRNIISDKMIGKLKIAALVFVGIIALLGLVRFGAYMSSDERHLEGTYVYEDKKIVLNKDASCNIDSLKSSYKIKSCTWEYDSDTKYVSIKYSYEYTIYKSTYSYDDTMSLKYENKTLSDYSNTYTKSKK